MLERLSELQSTIKVVKSHRQLLDQLLETYSQHEISTCREYIHLDLVLKCLKFYSTFEKALMSSVYKRMRNHLHT